MILNGALAGVIVVLSIIALDKLHSDDPVGAISVHGVVGIFGTLGIRVTKEQEYVGLDQVDCGVEAYPEFTSKKEG